MRLSYPKSPQEEFNTQDDKRVCRKMFSSKNLCKYNSDSEGVMMSERERETNTQEMPQASVE
jgi:hypothetical protein